MCVLWPFTASRLQVTRWKKVAVFWTVKTSCLMLIETPFKPGDEPLWTGAPATLRNVWTVNEKERKKKLWNEKGKKKREQQPLTISCFSSLADRTHTKTAGIIKSATNRDSFYLRPHSHLFHHRSTSGCKWQRNVWTIQMDKQSQRSLAE